MKPQIFASLLLFGLVACSREPSPAVQAPKAKEEPKKIVELHEVTLAKLNETIKAQKGKVVVVDVWATFCEPCKKEFPHFVELYKKHSPQDLACISVSVDDPDAKARALEFLKKQEATTTNFLTEYDALQKDWIFSGVPVVRVYAPSGAVAQQFANDNPDKEAFTYTDVEKVVQKLLKK